MLGEKIPDNTYEEVSVRPHNEISRVLLDMLQRPLKLVNTFNADPSFDTKILASFITEILTKDFNSTISNFVVPALGAHNDFPFIKLVRFLYDFQIETVRRKEELSTEPSVNNNNQIEVSQSQKTIKFNGYLLHSILKLDAKFLDDIINQNCLSNYLIVIGAMIRNISRVPKPSHYVTYSNYDDDDGIQEMSDSDGDSQDEDEEMQPQFERLILSDTIALLNEQTRVGKVVKNIDDLLYIPEVVHSLCLIAHNLMIYNRSAINEYR